MKIIKKKYFFLILGILIFMTSCNSQKIIEQESITVKPFMPENKCIFETKSDKYDIISRHSFRSDLNGGKISFKAERNGIKYVVNEGKVEVLDWKSLPITGGPSSCIDGDNLLIQVKHRTVINDNGKYVIQVINSGEYIGEEYDYIYDCSFMYTKDYINFIFEATLNGKRTIIKDGKNILIDQGELVYLTYKDGKITPIIEKNSQQFIVQEQCNLDLIND